MRKKNIQKTPPYYMVRFGTLIEEFQNESAHFANIMAEGAGIRTLGLIDVIRKIEHLYLQVACHLEAAKDIEGGRGVTLDDALDALEAVRAMDAETEQAET